jgi:hypothetical protein
MTTDQRIENLEKGLASARRFNRWLLAAVGLALGVWILAGTFGPIMAAAPGGGGAVKEIRANRFVVEDENGRVRAVLAVHKETKVVDGMPPIPEGRTSLDLFDEKGKARVSLTLSESEAGLFRGGATGLHVFGARDSGCAELTADNGGSLMLTHELSKNFAGLSANENVMSVCLTNLGGKVMRRAWLYMDKDGAGLELCDKNGVRRAALGKTETKTPDGRAITYPESSLLLFDAEGKGIWRAP